MSVTQTLMGPGSWQVTFKAAPDGGSALPESIRSLVGLVGWSVVIGPRGLTTSLTSDADRLAAVKAAGGYVGLILERPDEFSFAGQDPTWWLGTSDGAGTFVDDGVFLEGPQTTSDLIDEILATQGIAKGTVTNGTAIAEDVAIPPMSSRLQALNWICEQTDTEWMFRPDGTIDVGPSTTLFPAPSLTAATLITADPAGDEGGLSGVQSLDLSRSTDATGLASRAVVFIDGNDELRFSVASQSPSGVEWKDFNGATPSARSVGMMANGVSQNQGKRIASRVVAARSQDHRTVTLTSRTHNVTAEVNPGDRVWCYDLREGVYNTSNQVLWRGHLIHPSQLRVAEITWPITDSVGVYLRQHNGGTWYDVTSYVQTEDPVVIWVVSRTGRRRNQAPIHTSLVSLGGNSSDRSSTIGAAAAEQYSPMMRRAKVQIVGDDATLNERRVDDAVITSGDATLTSATAAFVAGDVGKLVRGAGIPKGTTIASRTSATEVEMSAAATVSDTGLPLVIGPFPSDSRVLFELVAPDLTGKWDAGQTRTLWVVRDKNSSPIAYILNAGGFRVTDNIEMRDGQLNPLVRMMFRRAATRTYEGLVFGEDGGTTSRTVTDGVTTSGSATVTSATAAFTSADVGRCIIGSGIPTNAIIVSVNSGTEVTINANATATASGLSLTITDTDSYTGTAIYRGTVAGTASLYFRTGHTDAFRIASGDLFMLGGTIKQAAAPSAATDVVRVKDMLPTVVPVANSGQGLGTGSYTAVTGGRAVVAQSFWTIPTGLKMQVRATCVFSDFTSGDTLGVQFYDSVSAAVVLGPNTLTTSTGFSAQVSTAWTDVPSTAWRGRIEVQNTSAARGNARACWLEYKLVNA